MTTSAARTLDLHLATSGDFDWLLGDEDAGRPWAIAPELAPAEVIRIVRQFPFNWLIVAGEEVVGIIGLKSEGAGRAEIGYGIAASRQGRGFATGAVALLLPILKDRKVSIVTAETSVENLASQRVLDNNEFECVGRRDDEEDEEDGPLILWEYAMQF